MNIYYMKLDGDCSHEQSLALYGMLPDERKESVKQAKREEIAKKRLYTGAFLQYVLSSETGIPVEKLHYSYNEWGKPELNIEDFDGEREKGLLPCFNLSHSGNYAIVAVSSCPVGIDIEHKRQKGLSLAKRCFCQEEYEDIMSLATEEAREQRFLEYWTMKEAYIKCSGEGLHIPLNSFLINRGENGISFVEKGQKYIGTFFMQDAYCVSLCTPCLTDEETYVKMKNERREIFLQDILTLCT